ncbi:MAG: FAD-binding oxidoreductase [Pseudomonadota bacterium]
MQHEPCELPPAYCADTTRLGLPALEGREDADIAVIGGGVTGSATALALAEAGRSVALLEAREIGFGGSGRSYGLILPIPKPSRPVLEKRYGAERASRLEQTLTTGPDRVYGLIDRHGIDCDAVRQGWIWGAHSEKALPRIRATVQKWQDQGAPVEYLDADAAARAIGGTRYPGAMLDRRCGSINPLKYTRGLAAAAVKAGARVYENSEALSVTPGTRRRWTLTTARGKIEADHVIHCTNAYTGKLWPGLRRTVIPVRAFQLVSAPISDNVLKTVLPDDQIMTDTRHLFSGIRKLPGGRIHMSTTGPFTDANGQPDRDEATARLLETFPQIGNVDWTDSWTAWVGMNPEHTPRISRLDEGMWSVIGYSGRGLAFGTLMGDEITRLMQDPSRYDLFLPIEPVKPIPFHGLARVGVVATTHWYRLVDRFA